MRDKLNHLIRYQKRKYYNNFSEKNKNNMKSYGLGLTQLYIKGNHIQVMYQSIPSLTIHPQAIFLMGEFPTPRARKEFKTSTPRPMKTS